MCASSVQPDVRVNDAWQTLAEHKVAQAPVVDALGRVIGLLLCLSPATLWAQCNAVHLTSHTR